MKVTSQEMLEKLKCSGYTRFTERQFTEFRRKQLLPPLNRTCLPGLRKPVYLWDEQVMEQAIYLHELLEWEKRHHILYLPLWLKEYDIPLRAVQRVVLRFVERYLTQLQQGKTDPDEILDQISTFILETLIPRWKYSPKPSTFIHSIGIEIWAEIVECFFDYIAVPDFIPDADFLISLIMRLNQQGKTQNQAKKLDQQSFTQSIQAIQQRLKDITPLFSLPRLRDTLLQAEQKEWEQARCFYREICDSVWLLLEASQKHNPDAHIPDATLYRYVIQGAQYCLPLLLTLICHGYQDQITTILRLIHIFLAGIVKHGWPTRPFDIILDELKQEYSLMADTGGNPTL